MDDADCAENEHENLMMSECWLSNGGIMREHVEEIISLQHQAG